MTYFLAEDTKISGKWIQLISRRMDIMDLSDSQSVRQSVCPPILTDRLTFINDLFRFRRCKKIRSIDNIENGFKLYHGVCIYLENGFNLYHGVWM